ncbi:MAG: hypothetical protein IPK00_24850 [Deltaproteobacteria bacterium]|nr:hypothetical protein [Deltaproteobacteria bacterium]
MGSASWHELRAERFTLLTDGSAATLEVFARDLARFIAVVDRVVQAPAPNVPARFVLLTRETQASFLQPWMEGVILSGVSGFYSFVRADEHSPIHRHTLLHEFTHYLTLRDNAIAYPHWYVEGFAELLGSTRTREDVMEVGAAPPHRIEELEIRRARRWKLEIEPLLAFDPGRGDHVATLDYASAWALVHFLHTSGERKAQLSEFLRLQIAGQSWEEAFAEAFPESPAELAQAVDDHTRRIARGVPDSFLFLELAQLSVDSEWKIRKLTRSEADVVLGETVMVYGNDAFAEAIFRDAVAHAPDDMRARTALIAALAAQGRFDAVRELIAKIDSSTLSDADSLAHLASALRAEAERMSPADEQTSMADRDDLFARAQSLYERATEIDPRSPVAWAGVARSRVARGNPNGALDAFEKASQTGELDGELMLDWGLAEKLAGREMEARIRWSFVLRQGTKSQRKRAAKLIAELMTVEEKSATGDAAS